MDVISSSSDSDIIDDTGCEDKFQSTYWDINYLHMIENDDEPELDEEEEEKMEEGPHARAIRRIQYSEVNISGEVVKEDYFIPNEEEEYDDSEYEEEEYVSPIIMPLLYYSDDSSNDSAPIELDPKLRMKMGRIWLYHEVGLIH